MVGSAAPVRSRNTLAVARARDRPDAILMVTDALTAYHRSERGSEVLRLKRRPRYRKSGPHRRPPATLNRKRVFEFAAEHKVPAIYEYDFLVRDGGLMSYGPDMGEVYDRAADLADRILRGARPADLPFEQPTHFRLVI